MTLVELKSQLDARGVDPREYVLDGVHRANPVAGAWYATHTEAGWEYGIEERGERDAWGQGLTETQVCGTLLDKLPGRFPGRRGRA